MMYEKKNKQKTCQGTQPDSMFMAIFASMAQKWLGKQSVHREREREPPETLNDGLKKISVALLPSSSFPIS